MPYVKSKNAQILMVSKKKPFELLTEYLSRPDAEELFTTHAKAFAADQLSVKQGDSHSYIAFELFDRIL